MMKIRVIIAAVVAIMLAPALSSAGNVILISNPSVQISTLSKQDVGFIFLGKKKDWDDGAKIFFAIQKDSQSHRDFLKNYIHKNPPHFSNYWKKQVFTGKGTWPRSFDSDQEMVKFIAETKGAIGYVSDQVNLANVKTISVK